MLKGLHKKSEKIFAIILKNVKSLNDTLELTVDDGEKKILDVLDVAKKNGIKIHSVNLRKPSLEDVFIKITGKGIREEAGSFKDRMRMIHGRMR